MNGQVILTFVMVLAILVWLGQLVLLYRMTEEERGDPIRTVSGASVFFVGAIPVARAAPGVVDGIGHALERAANSLFGRRGHAQTTSHGAHDEPSAILLIDGKQVPLVQERTRLGRYPNNEVVIEHSTVSAYHAEIQRRSDHRHEVIDRESRNGTRVNGALVRSQVLKDGDLITLGGATLHYLSSAVPDRQSAGFYSQDGHPMVHDEEESVSQYSDLR
jgi:hypothetical protein